MSKGRAPSLKAVKRVMRTVSHQTGGPIPKGSHATRFQRAYEQGRASARPPAPPKTGNS